MNTKSSYQYIFGPVPSRRLGFSLGIDIIPHKTCTLDCVYCECGKTTHLTCKRSHYIQSELVIEELNNYLETDPPHIDYITFSGSGEPTLNDHIDDIVDFIKSNYSQYSLALLTNTTLFSNRKLWEQIKNIDVVIASLDAGNESIFKKINRPHPQIHYQEMVDGLIEFRNQVHKQLWIEYFVVPELNDTEEDMLQFREITQRIHPDKIQLNSLDRPGTESWVQPVSKEKLAYLARYLDQAEVIHEFKAPDFQNSVIQPYTNRILSLLERRPCTLEDISASLHISLDQVKEYLHDMIQHRIIETKDMSRGIFYFVNK
ncbi:MAG: radical SAM protein [Desulfobacterales bacterium]|nr:radical SAM protein [Desulfobacterales bacterium]